MQMTDDEGAGVEFSPLSQLFAQGDLTVEVTIRRPQASAEGWTLEVIVDDDNAVVWEEPFATDREALEEFRALVAERGLLEVINPPEEAASEDV